MDNTFKEGDVVQLKANKVPMTVETSTKNKVRTIWFVGTKLYSGSFYPSELELVT